ncbi:alkyl/aryl-sulfatase [Halomonas sp. V046]|uniref:alkyl/aryl-sulfatase n=1 Tax=Halomonas sp. V046 TaxID=3459611 RepID=UPI004044C889
MTIARHHRRSAFGYLAGIGLVALSQPALAVDPNPATDATVQANQAMASELDFEDRRDFENAHKGFIAKPETLTIKDANGNLVWDLEPYKTFLTEDTPAPDTVNPSLWRNAQLNMNYGLFQVNDNTYQVRGYDITNITYVKGDTGWIVMDPLTATETAAAAHELVTQELGDFPIKAVIYSHSHVDHYAGVKGLVSQEQVDAGDVEIIAPQGFMEHAISEMVTAGNAMSRRAVYMYGAVLPKSAEGQVNAGLGQTNSTGTISLIAPTRDISATGEEVTIDGVRMVFQVTPGTEAPAEMNTYFPDTKALWMAENATNTLHNLYTLRGAQVRDGQAWAHYLTESIQMFPDAEVRFQSHHWPMWGNDNIMTHLRDQRDMYKYIHDQSVRMLNEGYTDGEIAEKLDPPDAIDNAWYNRGYYGTKKHDSRAVYQRYMGWYDANPANLDPLPPEPAAKKYVEYMGGEAAILAKAQADYDNGEYRWVAEALKHVVFANPDNQAAKNLLADAFEQMGYQAESGPWRNVYLQGAFELRNGVPTEGGVNSTSPDTIRAMPVEMLFDYLSIRTNGERAAEADIDIALHFEDLDKQYTLSINNGSMKYVEGAVADADANVTLTKAVLDRIQLGETTLAEARDGGDLSVSGDEQAFADFLGMLDAPPFWFNIVTP